MPRINAPKLVRGVQFGGSNSLSCVPLVAGDLNQLLQQANVVHRLAPDVVEWRANAYNDLSVERLVAAASDLRSALDDEPVVFTLRRGEEGGRKRSARI
jgi:3-dehydroquinate dehydratase I